MELREVMRTTFAAREFLDEPVDDDVLQRILDNARFAPSGGNRQGWHVIVVRDADKRAALAPLIEPTVRRYLAERQAGANPWNTVSPAGLSRADIDKVRVPAGQVERLVSAPLVLLVTVDLSVVASMDQHLPRVGVISGASIYPFVWNILLAARAEGLGGTLTTFVAAKEPQVQALFGIPPHHAVAAMLPIGKPVKQLTRLTRKPVSAFATVDAFEGDALADAPDPPYDPRARKLDRRAVLRMLQPVDSSNLESIACHAATRTLYVRFLSSGRVYAYLDMDREVFDELQRADSKGSYFNSMIRGAFPFEELY